jgi:8-oxo-dGTP pyrophosphatase MutT (NUDIX family)
VTSAELASRLARRPGLRIRLPGFTESAVLLPLVIESEEAVERARMVFTERRADLRTHAGQIAFPGGRRDPEDADLVSTALREAEEEIGLSRQRLEVLGTLDDVPTPTGFVITPVVGLVRGTVELAPHAGEVAAVFECSLDELMNPSVYRDEGVRSWEGIEYSMHEYKVCQRRIWGATARMVHQLLGCIAAAG